MIRRRAGLLAGVVAAAAALVWLSAGAEAGKPPILVPACHTSFVIFPVHRTGQRLYCHAYAHETVGAVTFPADGACSIGEGGIYIEAWGVYGPSPSSMKISAGKDTSPAYHPITRDGVYRVSASANAYGITVVGPIGSGAGPGSILRLTQHMTRGTLVGVTTIAGTPAGLKMTASFLCKR